MNDKANSAGRKDVPRRAALLLFLLLMCVPATVAAQEAAAAVKEDADYPASWCRNGLFASDEAEFKVATVGGNRTARIHFYNDDEGCPAPEVKCRTKRYLITGDRVLVSRRYGSWICGWYQKGKGSETVGWLQADKLLMPAPSAPPALKDWVGLWRYDGKTLTIRRDRKAGFLKVKGYAVWEGTRANAHVGGVEATAQPLSDELVLVEEECRVLLRLVGDYLVARDNSGCGGVNVRFDGVFRRGR
jgi:hypothetical protein